MLWGVALLVSGRAQTLPPQLAAPPDSVNTNLPGFKVRVAQGNLRFPLVNLAAVETFLRGDAIDPTTGNPVADLSVPGSGKGGIHEVPGIINWHEALPQTSGASGGLFTSTSNPSRPDGPVPGIAGDVRTRDYYAAEITGFLELPAGMVRLGVNSDDGFRLTFGKGLNPFERFQLVTAAQFDNNRVFGSTEANLTVTEAGFYPFRLVWWENVGPNSGLEFYAYAPGQTSGQRILINDTNQPGALRAYRDTRVPLAGPTVRLIEPVPGSSGASPAPLIRVEFIETELKIDLAKAGLAVDGEPLLTEVSRTNNRVQISAHASQFAPNSSHTATLVFADAAGSWTTNDWTFTVGRFIEVPRHYAVTDVDLSKPGFRIRTYQMPHERGPLTTGADGNALWQVQRALIGGYLDPATKRAYTNLAVVAGVDAEGFVDWPGIINFGQPAGRPADFGNFTGQGLLQAPDERLPGTTSTRHDHFVVEMRTFLRLSAGNHRFGVNSDEGFVLSVGQAAG